jgi:DNA-binding transcriptional LysR family regulator
VLYHEETVVICGAQNPIATCPPDQLPARMAAAEWVLPTSTTGASRLVATWLVNRGHNPPRITVESISPLATVGLLWKTDLLGILPLSVMRSFNHFGHLSALPVSLPQIDFPVGLIYRKQLENTLMIRTLVTLCDGLALTRAEGSSA